MLCASSRSLRHIALNPARVKVTIRMASSVADAFKSTVAKHPARPALVCHDQTVISFEQLDRVTDRCAATFFSEGQVVVVGVDEGRDLVAVELAIWKAGAIVCPFDLKKDPRAPTVLDRLQPDVVVLANNDTNPHHFPFKTVTTNQLLDWEVHEPPLEALQLGNIQSIRKGDLVSHLVFTSGTTGQPKCVGVTNQSLHDFAKAKVKRSALDENSRLFLASSFTFDPQLGDVACALISGACLILPSRQALLNGKLGELLIQSKTTHVCTTPAALSTLGPEVKDEDLTIHLRELLVGGEKMSPHLIERALTQWLPRNTRLVNTYGVTECCVYQSTKTINQRGDESLLGQPYDGVEVELYAFSGDDQGRRIENVEEEGEIVIRGSFVGLGYLKDASHEVTIEKETTRLTKKNREDKNEMIGPHQRHFEKRLGFQQDFYRTGDLGKYIVTADGAREIYFLGRRDAQFKINGVRIEAGEVEYALNSKTHHLVKQSVAINLDGKLVATIVLNSQPEGLSRNHFGSFAPHCQKAPSYLATTLQRHLVNCLPATYIPSAYFVAESIPLSATGKVDRATLTTWIRQATSVASPVSKEDENAEVDEAGGGDEESGDIKLRSDLERFIAKVWEEILGIPSVDPTDSFAVIGGDSLQALKAVNHILSRIREKFEESTRPLESDPILFKAISEAQAFGEIQGPFSAVTLLQAPSLRVYAKQLESVIAHSDVFAGFTQKDEESMVTTASNNRKAHEEVDQEGPDPTLHRALMDAARSGDAQCVRAILNLGTIKVDGRFVPRKRMCRTPLHEAARHGHLGVIHTLLDQYNARAMVVTELRVSPMHLAAMLDTPEPLLAILKHARHQRHDLKPLLIEDKNKQTPLHYAARSGKNRIIQAMVDEQLEAEQTDSTYIMNGGLLHAINMFDRWRRTPLHWAVVNLHVDTCKLLLDLGAEIIPEGMRIGRPGPGTHLVQETPLQVAIRRNAPDNLIDLLTKAEVAFRQRSSLGTEKTIS